MKCELWRIVPWRITYENLLVIKIRCVFYSVSNLNKSQSSDFFDRHHKNFTQAVTTLMVWYSPWLEESSFRRNFEKGKVRRQLIFHVHPYYNKGSRGRKSLVIIVVSSELIVLRLRLRVASDKDPCLRSRQCKVMTDWSYRDSLESCMFFDTLLNSYKDQ